MKKEDIKIKEKDYMFEPLDEEEAEYMAITESDDYELKSVENLEEEKKRYASYARHTIEQRNKKGK